MAVLVIIMPWASMMAICTLLVDGEICPNKVGQ